MIFILDYNLKILMIGAMSLNILPLRSSIYIKSMEYLNYWYLTLIVLYLKAYKESVIT